jgi:hypothetical protein
MTTTDVANDADVEAKPEHGPSPRRLLCAYAPNWLSGPVPGYEGLCPSADPHSEDPPRS